MTDLEYLRAHVPGYADYGDIDSRHHVDEQVRAYLGEVLADVRTRLEPDGALAQRFDGLLLRCAFVDQEVVRAADRGRFEPQLVERVHRLDRAIVELADRLRAVASREALAPLLDAAASLLDGRFGAIEDAEQS
jgi:hypothetical protein